MWSYLELPKEAHQYTVQGGPLLEGAAWITSLSGLGLIIRVTTVNPEVGECSNITALVSECENVSIQGVEWKTEICLINLQLKSTCVDVKL